MYDRHRGTNHVGFRSHNLNAALAELGPLVEVRPAAVQPEGRKVLLRRLVYVGAEVASEAAPSVDEFHERVEVGFAPATPDGPLGPKVHHLQKLLLRVWQGQGLHRERERHAAIIRQVTRTGHSPEREPHVARAAVAAVQSDEVGCRGRRMVGGPVYARLEDLRLERGVLRLRAPRVWNLRGVYPRLRCGRWAGLGRRRGRVRLLHRPSGCACWWSSQRRHSSRRGPRTLWRRRLLLRRSAPVSLRRRAHATRRERAADASRTSCTHGRRRARPKVGAQRRRSPRARNL